MSNRSRKSPRASPSPSFSVPLLILAAFLLGAGTMWLVMRTAPQEPAKPAIQTFGFTGQTPGGAPLAATPPDTSQLAPADAARTLGNWNYDRQNWAHAIEHYQEAITLGADTADVRTDLGNCFRFLDQPQKALEQYQLAHTQNPQHENSLFNQISLYGDVLHDKERALAIGHDFIAQFPQSSQAAAAKQLIDRFEASGSTGK